MSYLEMVKNQAAQAMNPVYLDSLIQKKPLAIASALPVQPFSAEPSLPESEETFLKCMEMFREIANRNIYGSRCSVFEPPRGWGSFNSDVVHTYYEMYRGVVEGTKALSIWVSFLENSAKYAVGGGALSVFSWLKDVALPTARDVKKAFDAGEQGIMDPTMAYLANQNYQGALTVAYIFGK